MTQAGASDTLRLFVAVELPEPLREALAHLQEALRRLIPADAVRWVRPEGIHLTLKFLGGVEAARLEALEEALQAAVAGRSPFELRPEAVGSFGGPARLRVIWLGIGGETQPLVDLAGAVDAAVTPLGFAPETRPFRGHLTLGRVRERARRADRQRIHAVLADWPLPELPGFRVDGVHLMRSHLHPEGARYEALAVLPLR